MRTTSTTRPPRAWAARAVVAVVLAATGVAAPVLPLAPASAAPEPVTPEAQTLQVPEVAEGAVLEGAAPPQDAPEVPAPSEGAVEEPAPEERGAAPDEPAVSAATGAVGTDDFRMVSVSWQPEAAGTAGRAAAEDAAVEVRVRTDDGWSEWTPLDVEVAGPDLGTADARGAAADGGVVSTEPLWVSGGADGVDVRVSGDGAASQDVEVTLIEPQTTDADAPGARAAADPAASASASVVGLPPVTSRAQWGADESLRTSRCPQVAYTGAPKVAFVHHTAGTNTYTAGESAAIMRGIYYHHTQVQGWCDIGYNMLIDKFGQVFEGRAGGLDRSVLGAHAAGFNADSFGVAVLGNYSTAQPSAAVTRALGDVIAWKMGLEHISSPRGTAVLTSAGRSGTSLYEAGAAVALPVITGHRSVGGTECPGAYLNAALPALRDRVALLMREKQWELRADPSAGRADAQVFYGSPGDVALACDFDGDGTDGIAVYSRGTWFLRGQASTGPAGLVTSYGSASLLPVCGDWDGDGRDSLGVYEPATGTWRLRNAITGGAPDATFRYGFAGTVPVAGDWDGVGRDGIGVYDGSRWFLRGTPTAGDAGAVIGYGFPGTTPVPGDWDGDGDDTLGVVAAGRWYLRDSLTPGAPDRLFDYGLRTDVGLAGEWDGGGSGIAVTRTWP